MASNPPDRTGVRSAEECRTAPVRTGTVRDGIAGNAEDRNGPHPNDGGAGTVAALGICLVLLGSSVLALVMVQASVAAVRAATAADLAALAGADALRGLQIPAAGDHPGASPGDACAVAGEVAARNNASLRTCTVNQETDSLTVEAEVNIPALPVPATARARAGPPG